MPARNVAMITLGALLLAVMPTAAGKEEPRRAVKYEVPAGNSIEVDGMLSGEEWANAAVMRLSGAGEVLLQHDGKDLLVGIRGGTPGLGHICIVSGKTIHVLHSSAALGSSIYQLSESEQWLATSAFEWEMRDPGFSEEALAARTAYLEHHGWVASTISMGAPNETEFRISGEKFSAGIGIAVIHAKGPRSAVHWPRGVSGAALDLELISGNTPESLPFAPSDWARLDFLEESESCVD